MKAFIRTCLVACLSVLSLHSPLSAQESSADTFDIYRISGVLCDRGVYTLIPRNAILHVPVGMEEKLQRTQGSRFLSMEQFIRRNYCWVHKMPVTVSEATGKVPISQLRMERIRKLGKVVIAVHKGRPVSVRQPEEMNEILVKAE